MIKESKVILVEEAVIGYQPVLGRAFGVCAALLLQQIHYRTIGQPVKGAEHSWVYNTYEQWAEMLGDYSAVAVRKVLKNLENEGILIVGTFNKLGFDRTRWYRIDYEILAEKLGSENGTMWQKVSVPSDKKYHMEAIKSIAPIPKTTTKTPTKTSVTTDVVNPVSNEELVGKVEEQPLPQGEKNMATVAEILAKHKAASPAVGKTTPSGMGMRWKKLLGAEGNYVKELTGKQLGQLKHLHKALGDNAMAVMEYCVLNWTSFCWEVRSSKGLATTPDKPDIGFLQQYHDVAVQSIAKKSSVATVPVVAKVELPQPVEPKAETVVEDKVSQDDILATLAKLDELSAS